MFCRQIFIYPRLRYDISLSRRHVSRNSHLLPFHVASAFFTEIGAAAVQISEALWRNLRW